MFENRIAKSFTTRRDLLRGAFPAAFDFLVELEERSAPVIWLSAAKSAQVYWQDAFLCAITFVGIGEANTGIRLTSEGGKISEGCTDRSALFFAPPLHELIERHGGQRHRWATLRDGGDVELRHPAPGAFFRDLLGLLQTTGARERADRIAAALESELEAEQPAPQGAAARTSERRPASDRQTSAAIAAEAATRAAAAATSEAAAASAVAAAAAEVASAASSATGGGGDDADAARDAGLAEGAAATRAVTERAAAHVAQAARATARAPGLRPSDTHRLIGFEHLVDAYVEVAAWAGRDPDRHAAASRRLGALEQVFLCRLPRLDEIRGPRKADRAQVIALAWRCLELATSIESPFLAPPARDDDTMVLDLWEEHGEALGTPIEALKRACRETFKSALMTLFPGIEETIVSEAELEEAAR